MSQLSVPTQVKVKTGYWNLMAVERQLVHCGFAVRYKPRYKHTWWTHSPDPAGERQP